MLIYIIICETECQDIFQKNYGKMTKKYQMMWMQEKRIHIYGKKGNNENENTEKCGFHGDDMIGKQVGAERVYDFTEKEDESMTGRSRIRTDLALEATERFQEENVEVHGVEIQEKYDAEKDVRTTVVRITTENGARTMGKPQGTYITIEAPDLSVPDEDYHREISEEVAHHLKELIDFSQQQSVLVVGLGNQDITADSLGPRAVGNIHMTRHVIREYGLKSSSHMKMHQISGIVPGVMAQTGMETLEIVQGVVAETKPDVVIAIDALAARSTARLNRTIQITDTGISPGSGVGNHREGLNEENLSVRVIGIGVPTVVDAATIVHDSMSDLLDALEEEEQKEFLEEMISPKLYTMFVTPKDVDETVKYLSFTISEGLNLAFSDSLIREDRS